MVFALAFTHGGRLVARDLAQTLDLLVSELEARLQLPGESLVEKVDGIEERPAPLDSAYTQWDVRPTPLPPDTNVPPRMDNPAHEARSANAGTGVQGFRYVPACAFGWVVPGSGSNWSHP